MLKEKDAVIRKLLIALDAFIIILVFLFSFYIRKHFHTFYTFDFIPSAKVVADMSSLSLSDYFAVLFFIVPIWCVTLYLNGMYNSLRTKTFLEAIWIIIRSAVFATFAFGACVFLFKLKFVSRAFFILFIGMSSFAILAEKIVIFFITHYIRKKGLNYRKLLIVGTGRRAANLIAQLKKHPEWGFRIFGVIKDEETTSVKIVEGLNVIGGLGSLQSILSRASIDEVIFVVPRSRLNHIENAIYICEELGIKATVAVDLFDLKISKSRQTDINGIPLVTFETVSASVWQLFIKRTIDVVFSGLGILLLSPLFLIIVILIKAASKGPALFIQKRVGLNGRKFLLYKFRSMRAGSHKRLMEFEKLNEQQGPIFKIKDDPRITPVGKFLRKYSLDELPQLFNVFIGNMSLVGPRPPLPKEVAQYEPWQRRRLSMRPGITCLWQIRGRSKIDFEEWMKLDLEYIDNWSLWLDLKILMKTIPAVLFTKGAY